MNRTLLVLAGLVVVAGAGLVGWLYFAGGSGEPTVSLTNPTITSTSTVPATEGTPTSAAGADETAFFIDQEQSQVRFEVTEELRGEPNQVVGFTNAVVGQFLVDPANPESAQISEIVVN